MKITSLFFLALAAFFPHTSFSQGTIYLSNTSQPSNGGLAVANDSWIAADVITGNISAGYMLNSVQLDMLNGSGSPSGLTVMVFAQSPSLGGVFPGSSIGTLNGSMDSLTAGLYTYTTGSSITLLPDKNYFIVLTDATPSATGSFEWSTTATYSYGTSGGWGVSGDYYSSVNGTTWPGYIGNLEFALNATPLPEPSTLSLLLLGGGVFVYGRRKLRVPLVPSTNI